MTRKNGNSSGIKPEDSRFIVFRGSGRVYSDSPMTRL